MKKPVLKDKGMFPEQYELLERTSSPVLSRRRFFKYMGTGLASFLLVSDVLSSRALANLGADERSIAEDTIAAWIQIGEDGKIKVFTGKVEVGQNIRTSLAQMVAEELFVPVKDIEMIMGDTRLTPYDRGTYGSLTTPQMGPKLKLAAASLREMLKELAVQEWSLGKGSLQLEKGYIHHPNNGKRLSYAQLANGKKLLRKVDEKVSLVPSGEWKIAGTSVPKINGMAFITGKHRYTSDMVLPGMLYGKVLRPPTYGARLKNIDTEKARNVQGVTVVQEGDFVGLTAPDSRTAAMALAIIEAEWHTVPQPGREDLFQLLKEQGETKEGDQEVEDMLQAAGAVLEQRFEIDYIAHVPLEPRAGLAEWTGDQLTVWTGTQRPFGVQEELQRTFQIPKDNIRVIMPDTGSGYGGKHTGEAGIEAAKLSKAVGKPVKVIWTREEEFKWAYFRPAGVIEARSTLAQDGKLAAWDFHNFNSGSAGIDTPYAVKKKNSQFHASESPLRQGSYRALASTANIFAIESQMDDLAFLRKMDPLAFRLQNLEDGRLKDVLLATTEAFGWTKAKPTEHGYGLACGAVKGGFVATCAEVQVEPGSGNVKILRLVTGFECGAIINPAHLKSQVIGCVLQGLGGALFEAVDFKDGKILNASLSAYRVPRFGDVAEVEVVLLDRKDLPSAGAGEAPIVGVAPSIRNAIFDASGHKINRLPMLPTGKVPV
ncbi:MAG TPA: molybdopterin cofactor-binding domain-containing protein [Cyclobacteriaceae bacterium]|nr:molybdopterin cofactor-binding domain-containing protein [Cyclobacteriaceae bacterium]